MSLLPETSRRVTELTSVAQARGRVPSLLVGVVRERALVHLAGAGEHPRADAKTQYRVGAITKSMTAAMVMQLRDEGWFGLDDLLYRHLPGTPIGGVTLRQLLAHVAGLQREPDGAWWRRGDGPRHDAFLADLAFDKLAHPPYQTFHYSDLAYGLLGAVLARVTGESWHHLLHKRLLEPLAMKRTTYQPVEPYARGYVVHPWHGTLREEPRADARAMAPAGQLWSTLADLAKWAAFLADPTPTVLARGTLDEMCAPVVISDLESWTAGYGLGLQLWRVGERVYAGHCGAMPGYQATLAVHRPTRTAVVAFANAHTLHGGETLGALGRRILTEVLDREPAPPAPWRPAPAPPPEVAALCGRWWWMGREYDAAWRPEADQLVITPLTVPERTPWRFTREGRDRWRGRSGRNDGETLAVRRDDRGAVTALEIAGARLTRRPDDPPAR
ncbi:MAG TPA: serine hydrolase domain-containing protein [Pilimelia sp.]|nr:serine hydrolase domain-containing protein [Pilimelia sp.]